MNSSKSINGGLVAAAAAGGGGVMGGAGTIQQTQTIPPIVELAFPAPSRATFSSPMSPYACFVQVIREAHRKKHPHENVVFVEFSRKCAEKWKEMTPREKKRFEEMSMLDRERHNRTMCKMSDASPLSTTLPPSSSILQVHSNNFPSSSFSNEIEAAGGRDGGQHQQQQQFQNMIGGEYGGGGGGFAQQHHHNQQEFHSLANSAVAMDSGINIIGDDSMYASMTARERAGMMTSSSAKLTTATTIAPSTTTMTTTTTTTGKKRRRTKDPAMPKRAWSAFFYFCDEFRPQIRSVHPNWKVGDIAKQLGQLWEKCEDKLKYEREAADDRKRYEEEMARYKSGEFVPGLENCHRQKVRRVDCSPPPEQPEQPELQQQQQPSPSLALSGDAPPSTKIMIDTGEVGEVGEKETEEEGQEEREEKEVDKVAVANTHDAVGEIDKNKTMQFSECNGISVASETLSETQRGEAGEGGGESQVEREKNDQHERDGENVHNPNDNLSDATQQSDAEKQETTERGETATTTKIEENIEIDTEQSAAIATTTAIVEASLQSSSSCSLSEVEEASKIVGECEKKQRDNGENSQDDVETDTARNTATMTAKTIEHLPSSCNPTPP